MQAVGSRLVVVHALLSVAYHLSHVGSRESSWGGDGEACPCVVAVTISCVESPQVTQERQRNLSNDNPGAFLAEDAPLLRLGAVCPSSPPSQEAEDAARTLGLAGLVGDARRVCGQGSVLPRQVGPAATSVERNLNATSGALHDDAIVRPCATQPSITASFVAHIVGVRVGVWRKRRRPAWRVSTLVGAGWAVLVRCGTTFLRLGRVRAAVALWRGWLASLRRARRSSGGGHGLVGRHGLRCTALRLCILGREVQCQRLALGSFHLLGYPEKTGC